MVGLDIVDWEWWAFLELLFRNAGSGKQCWKMEVCFKSAKGHSCLLREAGSHSNWTHSSKAFNWIARLHTKTLFKTIPFCTTAFSSSSFPTVIWLQLSTISPVFLTGSVSYQGLESLKNGSITGISSWSQITKYIPLKSTWQCFDSVNLTRECSSVFAEFGLTLPKLMQCPNWSLVLGCWLLCPLAWTLPIGWKHFSPVIDKCDCFDHWDTKLCHKSGISA